MTAHDHSKSRKAFMRAAKAQAAIVQKVKQDPPLVAKLPPGAPKPAVRYPVRKAGMAEAEHPGFKEGDRVAMHDALNAHTGTGPKVKMRGVVHKVENHVGSFRATGKHPGTHYHVRVTHINGKPAHEHLDGDKVYGKVDHAGREAHVIHRHYHGSHAGTPALTHDTAKNESVEAPAAEPVNEAHDIAVHVAPHKGLSTHPDEHEHLAKVVHPLAAEHGGKVSSHSPHTVHFARADHAFKFIGGLPNGKHALVTHAKHESAEAAELKALAEAYKADAERTAQYDHHHDEIEKHLDHLRECLKAHRKDYDKNGHWGHVGDVGHIHAKVKELSDHFMPHHKVESVEEADCLPDVLVEGPASFHKAVDSETDPAKLRRMHAFATHMSRAPHVAKTGRAIYGGHADKIAARLTAAGHAVKEDAAPVAEAQDFHHDISVHPDNLHHLHAALKHVGGAHGGTHTNAHGEELHRISLPKGKGHAFAAHYNPHIVSHPVAKQHLGHHFIPSSDESVEAPAEPETTFAERVMLAAAGTLDESVRALVESTRIEELHDGTHVVHVHYKLTGSEQVKHTVHHILKHARAMGAHHHEADGYDGHVAVHFKSPAQAKHFHRAAGEVPHVHKTSHEAPVHKYESTLSGTTGGFADGTVGVHLTTPMGDAAEKLDTLLAQFGGKAANGSFALPKDKAQSFLNRVMVNGGKGYIKVGSKQVGPNEDLDAAIAAELSESETVAGASTP